MKVFLLACWAVVDSVEVDSLRYVALPEVEVRVEGPHRAGLAAAPLVRMEGREVVVWNPSTSADWLAAAGGVYVQKSQLGGGSPMIRGFGANRLLYVVEGVRMNTAIFRSGNLHNVISVDPWLTDRVVMGLGVESVGYGSDAMGGVLEFRFVEPRYADSFRVGGRVMVRGGTAAADRGVHWQGGVRAPRWAWRGGVSWNRWGDVRMGSRGPLKYLRREYVERVGDSDRVVVNPDPRVQVPSGFGQRHLLSKVRAQVGSGEVEHTFYYSVTSKMPRYDRLLQRVGGRLRYAEWYYGPMRWMMHRLAWGGRWMATHSVKVQAAYQRMEESRHRRLLDDVWRKHQYEAVDAYSVNVDGLREWDEGEVRYGVEGVWNRVRSWGRLEHVQDGTMAPGPPRYPSAGWYSVGAYVTGHRMVGRRWAMAGGVRWNGYGLKAEFDTFFYPLPFASASLWHAALAGKVGLHWRPSARWWVRMNAGSGFRAPNVDDMGKVFDSEPGAVVVPNPRLRAERAYTVDVHSVAWWGGERWRTEGGVFYTWLRDVMVRRPYRLNGRDSMEYDGVMSRILAVQNGAFGEVWGAYADVEWRIEPGWRMRGRVDWQEGDEWDADGAREPMRHVVPLFGKLQVGYEQRRWGGWLGVDFSGPRPPDRMPPSERKKAFIYPVDAEGRPYVPGWWTLNGRVWWTMAGRLRMTVGVDNILDRRYWPYGWGMAAPGRNVHGALVVEF